MGEVMKIEIELKKINLKMSILKQARTSTISDFNQGQVLGWCVISNIKFIVIYVENTKTLSKYQMFKEVKRGVYDNKMTVEVYFTSIYNPARYSVVDTDEQTDFIRLLERIKNNTESLGQFYI